MCHSTYVIGIDRSSARLDYVLLSLVVLRYGAAVVFRDMMIFQGCYSSLENIEMLNYVGL